MFLWMWVAAWFAAVWAAHALYVKETVRSPAFMAVINISLWSVVGFGSTGVHVPLGDGSTQVFTSNALAAFSFSMAAFGIIVFVIAIFAGYGDDDGSDEPDITSVRDIGRIPQR